MSTELKPCPFCNSPAKLEELGDHHGEFFNLGCLAPFPDDGEPCPGYHVYYTALPEEKEAAIAAWNRRPAEEALTERVRELHIALFNLELYLRDTPHHNSVQAAAARSLLTKGAAS